jgi:hypothetical protein
VKSLLSLGRGILRSRQLWMHVTMDSALGSLFSHGHTSRGMRSFDSSRRCLRYLLGVVLLLRTAP